MDITLIVLGAAWQIDNSWKRVVPDVHANDRIRGDRMPAFLKPLPDSDFLPSFITVLSSIPTCREKLLALNALSDDYGNSADWWKGEDVQLSSLVYNSDGTTTSKRATSNQELIQETQRLIAFFELTERAYGSAESLSRLRPLTLLRSTNSVESAAYVRFMQAWSFAAADTELFVSKAASDQNDESLTDVWSIVVTWGHLPSVGDTSLTTALDNVFWEKTMSEEKGGTDFFLEAASSILNICLPSSNSRIEVPLTFYADRYMLENSPVVQRIRDMEAQRSVEVRRIEQQLDKLQHFDCRGKTGTAEQLFGNTLPYLRERSMDPETDDLTTRAVLGSLESMWDRVKGRIKCEPSKLFLTRLR